ncbi:GspH/FimT family pseudopilin [Dyella jiangningensis]|uniref:GspH/FimT family pseudopilin n=1 Tax=Dyella jiangningensis TaxID=1379159 RepID=UPI00240F5424|nr:GspH/FimT family pseudopilin [Dyella jiangningensis]MDG2540077.1 GspH/FimT family pseudopilin [Dyella jiangningensis]
MNRRREEGFTLIELLMTMAVFVVITLIALPYLGSFIQSQRMKNASMDITSSVSFARSEAIKRNAQVDITANAGGWANGWQISVSGNSLRKYDAYGDLSISAKKNSTTLSFGGDGRMVTGADSFTVQPTETNKQQPLCVAVGTSGHVTTTGGACG